MARWGRWRARVLGRARRSLFSRVLSCRVWGPSQAEGLGKAEPRKCSAGSCQACPLQMGLRRRSAMLRLWPEKHRTRLPVCSLSSRTCRGTWNGGRASLGACRARTWARWCLTQAAQVSSSPWSSWGRGRRARLSALPCPTVSTLEKTLPQLLAKLGDLENRGGHNASLALSANIGRVRELIAQARGAASKVGGSPRTWRVGVPGPGGWPGDQVLTTDFPVPTGQGAHEVQWALLGATACPAGPC